MTRWVWFGAWVAVGAAGAFGMISFVGFLALLPAAGVTALMVRRPTARETAFGALTGAGLLLLVIAYLHRHGPGTVCSTLPDGGERCDEELNPLPWLVIGILLVGAGVLAQLLANRRSA